jgi:hypothetical protein
VIYNDDEELAFRARPNDKKYSSTADIPPSTDPAYTISMQRAFFSF